MVKPFSMAELQARIEAVLRRTARAARAEATLQVADLRVDLNARQVWLSDRKVNLTRKEFDLLMALTRQAGTIVSRERLLMDAWQTTRKAGHTLDVQVAALCGKLDDAGLVETVRGVGYRLRPS
ncbi:DNA-binding response regulator [Micromonospora sp. NPDC007230]|uniref:winged helix-turn-helix domain-containing protein n=1 Tax=Micromonospora sp. NPDC007230 TaxID=3364237 RepID=UPI0036C3BE0A